MNNSIWNTCIHAAITKAKLASTLIPLNEVNEMISELEKLKKPLPSTSKEPEAVHGNEAGKGVCRTFYPDGKTTSATTCMFCGKEKWQH